MHLISLKAVNGLLLIICALLLSACSRPDREADKSTLTLTPGPFKTFNFSWDAVDGADYYRLIEYPDGTPNNYRLVKEAIPASTLSVALEVPLFSRAQARYALDACFELQRFKKCREVASRAVSGDLVDSIGYFKASDAGWNKLFGRRVALSDDGRTLAVVNGGQGDPPNPDTQGQLYIFTKEDTGWIESFTDRPPYADLFKFEPSLSLSGDGKTVAIGAGNIETDGQPQPHPGSVVIYQYENDTWSDVLTLSGANLNNDDNFGYSVSLSQSGDTLAVGSQNNNSVYLFARQNGVWNPVPFKVLDGATMSATQFGTTVALNRNGRLLAVGAADEAYVFSLSGQTSTLLGSAIRGRNTKTDFAFGLTLALSGDTVENATLVVGDNAEDHSVAGVKNGAAAPTFSDGAAIESGAAYVFTFRNGDWQQQAYFKASNPDSDDGFGGSVSLSLDGNTLVVGAGRENSDARGVHPGVKLGPADNNNGAGAPPIGAAYLFQRSPAGEWHQAAYIKPSNTHRSGFFGGVSSLSGDASTLAIAAFFENNNSRGIYASPPDNGVLKQSGAVYLY